VRHLREEESMNRKFRSGDGYSILGGLVGLCLFLSLFALPQQSWGAYYYVELPPGWLNPQVNGINNSKSIVGWGGADLTNKGFVFDSNSKAYSEVFFFRVVRAKSQRDQQERRRGRWRYDS